MEKLSMNLLNDLRLVAQELENVKRILNEITLGKYVELTPKKVINQCTEKEFPSYKLTNKECGDEFIKLSLDESCKTDNLIKVSIEYGYFNLYPDEFRKFTKGCERIVEWLEQNETT